MLDNLPPALRWPKPSSFPVCTFVLLVVNVGLFYGLLYTHSSQMWGVGFYLTNAFFFWAERDIYKREKRNFDGWNREMIAMMEPNPPKNAWTDRLKSVQRKKRSS